ncbi:MAG: 3-hydroxyacyl-ACP dehydratase FabZ [Bordetella sp.]|nr:MAG: 3-hydroxyacyl-ACP dehydratase FabZ [Bordetella sp.]
MELTIDQIKARLPHRYPMLLIDRVLEIKPGKSIIAIKNVSINEPFFEGHFPHFSVMPGVLIIEAMAQAAALFSFDARNLNLNIDRAKTAYYLVGVNDARFRKPVVPGDQLRLEVEAERLGQSICKYRARAFICDKIAAEAKLMCAVRDLEE